MSYKLLYHDSYARETSIYDFNLLTEVAEYLYNHGDDDLEDYQLLKVVDEEYDLRKMLDAYVNQRADVRKKALSKLTDEEKAVLGLTKA